MLLREYKKTAHSVLFLILVGIIVVISWKSHTKKEEVIAIPPIPVSVTDETKVLSTEEYKKIRDEFIKLEDDHDPRFALSELRERIKTDASLLRSCHTLVHTMGREAYLKYKDFGEAMKYRDEMCNSGYLHGIIEAYFSKSKDVFKAMQSACTGYPIGSFIGLECYHGIGHGLMYYTENDLPRSITMCSSYKNEFARSNCVMGVFMENFNTDQKDHVSKYLKKNDPSYPCQEQDENNKSFCYLNAPQYYLSLHKNEYVNALNWCAGVESAHQKICVYGVGGQAIMENAHNATFVEKMCMSGEPSLISSCIAGMVDTYVIYYGALEPAKELCEELQTANKETLITPWIQTLVYLLNKT